MKHEIDPKETNRAMAFELWMKSPMPMVTLTKTFDVTRLCRVSHRRGIKFNMLLCWCIGKTASRIDEFYLLPEQGKLMKYDRLAINVIVNNKGGGINSCHSMYPPSLMSIRNTSMRSRMVQPPFFLPPQSLGDSVLVTLPTPTGI